MYTINGVVLRPRRGFTVNGVNYPGNWLDLATEAEKEALGIVYTAPTPRQPAVVPFNRKKQQAVKADRKYARELLSETDWYVIRAYESNRNVPAAVRQYRAAIRAAQDTREAEIVAATNETDLQQLTEWPDVPE